MFSAPGPVVPKTATDFGSVISDGQRATDRLFYSIFFRSYEPIKLRILYTFASIGGIGPKTWVTRETYNKV